MEQSVAAPADVVARRERFAEAVLAFLARDHPVLTYPEFPSPETGVAEVHAVQQMLVPAGQLDVLLATFPGTRSREVPRGPRGARGAKSRQAGDRAIEAQRPLDRADSLADVPQRVPKDALGTVEARFRRGSRAVPWDGARDVVVGCRTGMRERRGRVASRAARGGVRAAVVDADRLAHPV